MGARFPNGEPNICLVFLCWLYSCLYYCASSVLIFNLNNFPNTKTCPKVDVGDACQVKPERQPERACMVHPQLTRTTFGPLALTWFLAWMCGFKKMPLTARTCTVWRFLKLLKGSSLSHSSITKRFTAAQIIQMHLPMWEPVPANILTCFQTKWWQRVSTATALSQMWLSQLSKSEKTPQLAPSPFCCYLTWPHSLHQGFQLQFQNPPEQPWGRNLSELSWLWRPEKLSTVCWTKARAGKTLTCVWQQLHALYFGFLLILSFTLPSENQSSFFPP